MCTLLEIKYYTVLVMYTFALQSITGAEKKIDPPENSSPSSILKLNVAHNLLL